MLWKLRVKFDLIDRRLDLPHLLEFLEVRDGPVAKSNGFHLARCKDILHLCPCLAEIPVAVGCSSAIRIDREEFRAFILPAINNGFLRHNSIVEG